MPLRIDPMDDEIRRIVWGDPDERDLVPSAPSPDLQRILDEYLRKQNPPRGAGGGSEPGAAGGVAAKSYRTMRGAGRRGRS